MSNDSSIELHIDSGIATLALNRPEKRNAISDGMRTELIAALEQVARDPAIRALVLTGNGKDSALAATWPACSGEWKLLPATSLSMAGADSNACITPCPCCTPCRSRPSPQSTARLPGWAPIWR